MRGEGLERGERGEKRGDIQSDGEKRREGELRSSKRREERGHR